MDLIRLSWALTLTSPGCPTELATWTKPFSTATAPVTMWILDEQICQIGTNARSFTSFPWTVDQGWLGDKELLGQLGRQGRRFSRLTCV